MKRFLPVILFIIIAIGAYQYGYNRRVPNPDPNHTHADFAVWINGTLFDFAQEKYMTEELTANQLQALENSTATGSSIQVLKQYLHLHDLNGHVLHRHKPGLGFGDFLKSLSFNFTGTCLTTDTGTQTCNEDMTIWRLFVNGKEISPIDPNYVFTDGDHILLTYGASDAELQHEWSLMTDDACRYSETCPGRGPAPTESCISDPTIPCKAP